MNKPTLISAYPSKERATLARRSFYFTMISSLTYLVSVATSGDNRLNILSLVRTPTNVRALDPRLFYLHDALLLAMRRKDSNVVSSLLRSIEEVAMDAGSRSPADTPEISTVGRSDWETFIVENSKTLGEGYFKARPVIDAVSEDTVTKQSFFVAEAIDLIKNNFPGMYDELKVFLNKLRIFQGAVTMGITDVRMFGCMFIRVPRDQVNSQLYYAEHLTHEISHMYLNAAMSLDPIILNDPSERFTSPIRPDPRPMLGVFHATFVTSRIVQLFAAMAASSGDQEVKEYLFQQLDELRTGIDEISRGAKLTTTGIVLLDEFKQIADQAEELSFWTGFDHGRTYVHRFGGGKEFRRRAQRATATSAG